MSNYAEHKEDDAQNREEIQGRRLTKISYEARRIDGAEKPTKNFSREFN